MSKKASSKSLTVRVSTHQDPAGKRLRTVSKPQEVGMTYRIDSKGKIFTDVVRKDEVAVLIQTVTGLIHGHVYLRPEQRIKDELNTDERFIAVTEAEVYGPTGEVLYHSQFLTLNKSHIIWVRPDEAPTEKG